MNTNTYINKKKSFEKVLDNLSDNKGYSVITDNENDIWKIFDKDLLIAEVQIEIMDLISIAEIKVPLCDNLGVAEEIFLRPIVTEYDFRERLGEDKLRKVADKLEIFRQIKFDNRRKNKSEKFLLGISDIITKANTISQELQNKMDLVMHIKLN
jgi:hypothetical protein